MKLKFIVLTFLSSIFFSEALFAKSWPIFCRTGPKLNVSIYTKAIGGADITIQFERLAKAAGQNFENLQPGECSWPDRAFNANEPTVMVYRTTGNVVAYILQADGSVKVILLGQEICNLNLPNGYFFRAHAEKKGKEFIVSRLEYPIGAGGNYSVPSGCK